MGISNSLPVTGYIKMVDIWMITTMAYPFSVIVLHCALEVSKQNLKYIPFCVLDSE